jgi:phosphomevalonate kinase
MRVAAPGKLLLAGAYAVLDGAPALVVAIDRYAVADGARQAASPTPEVLAALPAETAPEVDASALREGAFKLGLGSSAAILVASLGVAYVRGGRDLRAREVRDAMFAEARRAHARVQAGGSGVDVAASVHGGAVEYQLGAGGATRADAARLPTGMGVEVFWCGAPAITTDMRGRVSALRSRDAGAYRARIREVGDASSAAIAAARSYDASAFLAASRGTAAALLALGHDADAPIVPPALVGLASVAEAEGGAFIPSGAGGGDVFVYLGLSAASPRFSAAAAAAGMRPIHMQLDLEGVRLRP